MTVVLFRIDERLIHGQVVIGWGSQLRPSRYLVVDDDLAKSAWEQELYRLGLPTGTTAEFTSVEEARKCLEAWRASEERSVLLTRGVDAMLSLARGGLLEGEEVNLGGIHHDQGRKAVLRYVHLNDADRRMLEALRDEGVQVTARDLPGAQKIRLASLLE